MAELLAWHSDPLLKQRTVERMRAHRDADNLEGGSFLENPVWADEAGVDRTRGCFIGCLVVDVLAAENGLTARQVAERWWAPAFQFEAMPADPMWRVGDREMSWHEHAERMFGIPRLLAYRLDNIFESFPSGTAAERAARADWSVALVEAIPVGADLVGLVEKYDFDAFVQRVDQMAELPSRMLALLAAAPVPAGRPA